MPRESSPEIDEIGSKESSIPEVNFSEGSGKILNTRNADMKSLQGLWEGYDPFDTKPPVTATMDLYNMAPAPAPCCGFSRRPLLPTGT
ncbi:hypothetical protein VTO42DRAFT_4003 [Malbranchea cinnamomea]